MAVDGARREQDEPGARHLVLPAQEVGAGDAGHAVHRRIDVISGKEGADRLARRGDGGCPTVQLDQLARKLTGEALTQEVAEQVVEAVDRRRHRADPVDEEVARVEVVEDGGGGARPAHGGDGVGRELVQHRAAQQAAAHVIRLAVQHLVEDERAQLVIGVSHHGRATSAGADVQGDRGGPAAAGPRELVGHGRVATAGAEQLVDVGGQEAKLGEAQLGQLAADPPPSQPDIGVAAGGDDHAGRPRQVLDDAGQEIEGVRPGQRVRVVEDHDRSVEVGQIAQAGSGEPANGRLGT